MEIQYIMLIVAGLLVFYFSFRHFIKSCLETPELLEEPYEGFMSREELLIAGYKIRKMVPDEYEILLHHSEIELLAQNIDDAEFFEMVKQQIIFRNKSKQNLEFRIQGIYNN